MASLPRPGAGVTHPGTRRPAMIGGGEAMSEPVTQDLPTGRAQAGMARAALIVVILTVLAPVAVAIGIHRASTFELFPNW